MVAALSKLAIAVVLTCTWLLGIAFAVLVAIGTVAAIEIRHDRHRK